LPPPESATPLGLAVYQEAEKLHPQVRELRRLSAEAVCSPPGSDWQWTLNNQIAALTAKVTERAEAVGTDANTLIGIAQDQMEPVAKAEVWFV
jgi:hypothetical protein